MKYKPYPAYKDSGVGGLGVVPAEWEAKPLKRMSSCNDDVLPESTAPETEIEYVDISSVSSVNGIEKTEPMRFESAPSRARRRVQAGDVIISTVRTYLKAIAPVTEQSEHVVVSTGFAVIRPKPGFEPSFARYALHANYFMDQVVARSVGVSYPAINASELTAIKVATPTRSEQTTIATFLDRETAKLDTLIAKQEKLIELLQEKRQALISHAVTKGLNPDVPMKESGVAWLGKIPAHWETSQSRRMFAVRSEPALSSDKMLTASQKYGVIFQSDFVEREGRRVVEVIMGVESLRHVEPNDFIISMRSFQGGIEWCRLRGSTSFHYVMLRPVKGVHPPFFAHLFKSIAYVQALRATTDLIRDGQELRYSHFSKVDLPVIPTDEQASIAEFLDHEAAKIDTLIEKSRHSIDLMREHRAALISAAVTGKIDVRETA